MYTARPIFLSVPAFCVRLCLNLRQNVRQCSPLQMGLGVNGLIRIQTFKSYIRICQNK